MATMIVCHRVKNFKTWKMIFDAAGPLRKINGEKSCEIFHNTEDPDDLTILFEWDDVQKAIAYSQSEDLSIGMKKAGVIDDPKLYLREKDMG